MHPSTLVHITLIPLLLRAAAVLEVIGACESAQLWEGSGYRPIKTHEGASH